MRGAQADFDSSFYKSGFNSFPVVIINHRCSLYNLGLHVYGEIMLKYKVRSLNLKFLNAKLPFIHSI